MNVLSKNYNHNKRIAMQHLKVKFKFLFTIRLVQIALKLKENTCIYTAFVSRVTYFGTHISILFLKIVGLKFQTFK